MSANGVFGAKLTWWQFCEFTAELARSEYLTREERAFVLEKTFRRCRYILLRRRDRLRQAVSYSRALQTGRWSSKTISTRKLPLSEMFDIDGIDELIKKINRANALWMSYLDGFSAGYIARRYIAKT